MPGGNLEISRGQPDRPVVRGFARDIEASGGGEVAKQVAVGLSRAGWRSILVTDTPRDALTLDGVEVVNTPLGGVLLRWAPRSRFGWWLRHWLQIVCFTFFGTMYRLRKPTTKTVDLNHNCEVLGGDVYVMHNVFSAQLRSGGVRGIRLIKRALNPITIFRIWKEKIAARRRGRVFVAVSEGARSEVEDLVGVSRTVVITNGVDTEKFKPIVNVEGASQPSILVNRTEIEKWVLFVGHEFERKGLGELIESMRYVKEKIGLCVVGGKSQDTDRYRELAKEHGVTERVVFVGEVKNTVDFYNYCQVFAMPSKYETFGMVYLEALSCGVPVVMLSESPVSALVDEKINGALCEMSPQSIARAIEHSVKLPDSSKARSAIRETASPFAWESVLLSYSDLVSRVLDDSGDHEV